VSPIVKTNRASLAGCDKSRNGSGCKWKGAAHLRPLRIARRHHAWWPFHSSKLPGSGNRPLTREATPARPRTHARIPSSLSSPCLAATRTYVPSGSLARASRSITASQSRARPGSDWARSATWRLASGESRAQAVALSPSTKDVRYSSTAAWAASSSEPGSPLVGAPDPLSREPPASSRGGSPPPGCPAGRPVPTTTLGPTAPEAASLAGVSVLGHGDRARDHGADDPDPPEPTYARRSRRLSRRWLGPADTPRRVWVKHGSVRVTRCASPAAIRRRNLALAPAAAPRPAPAPRSAPPRAAGQRS
jgi:hypothetical protein